LCYFLLSVDAGLHLGIAPKGDSPLQSLFRAVNCARNVYIRPVTAAEIAFTLKPVYLSTITAMDNSGNAIRQQAKVEIVVVVKPQGIIATGFDCILHNVVKGAHCVVSCVCVALIPFLQTDSDSCNKKNTPMQK